MRWINRNRRAGRAQYTEVVQINLDMGVEGQTSPLYRQLAERLRAAINSGEYKPGDRLPTEKELAAQTGLSKGTIKSAYAHLASQGAVRRVRGSGVYVREAAPCAQPPEEIVEQLFHQLTTRHGMTVADAHRFFQEKLDDAFLSGDDVHVTLVDCNIETINVAKKQLEQVPGIALDTILFDDLLFTGDAIIDPECELVLTTQLHYPGVLRYTEPLQIPTEPYSIRENRQTLSALARLPEHQRVCVVYRSEAFLSSVRYTWRLAKKRGQIIPCPEEDLDALNRYCKSGLPFLLPPDYMEACASHALQAIFRARAAGSPLIPIHFEIDQGSILHIANMVESLREKRATA